MNMDISTWKHIFEESAASSGFQKIGTSLVVNNQETTIVLDLQKSQYGNSFYLNINIFVNVGGVPISQEKIGKMGDIFRRQPPAWDFLFDLDNLQSADELKKQMILFFGEFVIPFTKEMETKVSILRFAHDNPGEISLSPAVRTTLGV